MKQELVFITLFAAVAALAACGRTSEPVVDPSAGRYLALGDSYTIGEGVPESQRWPVQLANALRAEGLAFAAPEIIARTGWTTDELDSAITRAQPQGPYDLVTLLIGVNNQYRGRDANEFEGQFSALLDRAIGFAGGSTGKVIVLSIPDWGTTPFASGRDATRIGAEIDRFNSVVKQVCDSRGIVFIDITGATRAQPTLTASDGLHPSGEMYRRWVEAVLPSARAALTSVTAR